MWKGEGKEEVSRTTFLKPLTQEPHLEKAQPTHDRAHTYWQLRTDKARLACPEVDPSYVRAILVFFMFTDLR